MRAPRTVGARVAGLERRAPFGGGAGHRGRLRGGQRHRPSHHGAHLPGTGFEYSLAAVVVSVLGGMGSMSGSILVD